MKVYTSLITFALDKNEVSVLTDQNDNVPTWSLKDEEKETLDIVRDGLYNISGIDKNWYGNFNQAGVFEFWLMNHKYIYIIYTIYFPSTFNLTNELYKWTNIKNIKEGNQLYNIIRYLYGLRK